MTPVSEIDPHESPRALFVFELRRYRTAANLTQKQLAERIGFSESMVAMIESLKRAPSQRFAELCDRAFGLDGTMTRLHVATTWHRAPEHFRPWLEEEQDATALKGWEPMLIPGLLQTEAYARELFAAEPGISGDEVDERIAGRMQRQSVLDRDDPPFVVALIDEAVLHRPIGDAEVRREQLKHLLEVAQRPQVTIQVVPQTAQALCGLLGGFIVAERNGSSYAAYVEGQPNGRIVEDRPTIVRLLRRYDALSSEAVPYKQSLKLIHEVVDHDG
ncbi:helix-turn-helix domain-containing protein [Sphaerisporangium perillae]|uniref:helix-turn-helix domain-containing protein n=1 Tax=Sphaerisporangium perillae TaxID=2935860 RepID=UPI002010C2AE|nr:helix-turn-helix transcriptional regulator [Sphaerisporangium perillae]